MTERYRTSIFVSTYGLFEIAAPLESNYWRLTQFRGWASDDDINRRYTYIQRHHCIGLYILRHLVTILYFDILT